MATFPLLLTGALATLPAATSRRRAPPWTSLTERINSGVGLSSTRDGVARTAAAGRRRAPPAWQRAAVERLRRRRGHRAGSDREPGRQRPDHHRHYLVRRQRQGAGGHPKDHESPRTPPLPKTDVDHIVLVTQGVAAYLGQQVLGERGKTSARPITPSSNEYTCSRSRATSTGSRRWSTTTSAPTSATRKAPASSPWTPKTPTPRRKLKTGYHMRYLPDAMLNQDFCATSTSAATPTAIWSTRRWRWTTTVRPTSPSR